MKLAKQKRAAQNAFRLLLRSDARSVRRCKYWLRQYGVRDFTPEQLRRPQAPFELCCIATGVDPHRWDEPVVVDLGGGVFVKDTREHLEAIGLLDD